MKLRALSALVAVVLVCSADAQNPPGGETTYFVVYRNWDDPAMHMTQSVKSHVNKNTGVAGWRAVNMSDTANKPFVDHYQLSRAPTPLVLAVHGNGAVTGAFASKVTESQLASCLVSPVKAACMKHLQQNQLVLLCVQSSPLQGVPAGVQQFRGDPHYAQRTQLVVMQQSDPREAGFLKDINQGSAGAAPYTVLFAPPGEMVGKFPVNASMSDMAAALHAAGKCCNDPNCKHNHK